MKKLLALAGIVGSAVLLTACGNKQFLDTTYTFNKAMIKLQDGTVTTIDIESWTDFDGEQLQIKSKDGVTYLVNSMNCTLFAD